jgi:hypothetical protein
LKIDAPLKKTPDYEDVKQFDTKKERERERERHRRKWRG